MALFQASDFSGYSATYAVPTGVTESFFSGSVDIILSTGIIQQVFDALSTAIKCIHYMEANILFALSPNEDIIIIHLRSKLLSLENTHINQTMMSSYVFTYHGSGVRAIHRSMADTVSLAEALSPAGFRCIGLPWDAACNTKMERSCR